MRNRVYKTVRCPSVCPSVSLSHQSNAAAACGGFAAERRTRKRYRSTAPGARQQERRSPGRSTALSSKCGQCHVDSRINEAEHRLGLLSIFFRPIKILAVFTACVKFVSGWQHARNYISTHWADWTWMDRRTKIRRRRGACAVATGRISSWKIWQP